MAGRDPCPYQAREGIGMTDEQWLRLELRNRQAQRHGEMAARLGRLLHRFHRRQRPSSSS